MKKQWDSLFIGVNLATMLEGSYGIIEKGAIATLEGKIAWLGSERDLPGKPGDLAKTVYPFENVWLTPGLIDCHTHLVYGGNRANEFAMRLQGRSYAEIAKAGGGIRATVAATRVLTEQALLNISEKRLQHFIQEGVTTIEIKSGYGLDMNTELKQLSVAKQLEKYSIRVQKTFLGAHALPPEYTDNADGYIDLVCNTILPKACERGLVDAVDAFCETIGFTLHQVEKVFQKAKALGLPLKLHAEQLSDSQGARLAAKYKALSADHLEYASENSIQQMATSGTVAVLLPGAFYFLQETKHPPMAWLKHYNVPIAIATDCNPGSSPTTSLLLMLNMACVLFGLTPEEALQGITCNAAKALGLQALVGTLAVGKQADFALWDIHHPDDLAYYFGENPCCGRVFAGNYN